MVQLKRGAPPGRVVFQVGPVTVSLDPAGGDRTCHYERQEGYERESLAMWAQIASKGTVLDVGAYTGLYSIAAAKLGAEHVFAWEPMPIIRGRLRENIAFNEVKDKITVISSAVSDKDGAAWITFSPASDFTAGASLSGALSAAPLREGVFTMKLDGSEVRTNVTAIKIDVERHELEVVAGATEIIRTWRPRMIVECWTEGNRTKLAKLLPGYKPPRQMDIRNVYLEPS